VDTSLEEMFSRVLRALEGIHYETHDTPVFRKALEWMGNWPPGLDVTFKRRLIEATCSAFNIKEAELFINLDKNGQNGLALPVVSQPANSEADLRAILPKGGWFEWYDKYTLEIEAPLSYSIFSSLCTIGAALGRRVWLRQGEWQIWPNYCVILIGPPGLAKTTSGDIATKLAKEAAICPMFADQVTPERMISVLKESGHRFMYVGEMSTFFGRQKYNDGLVTKMLRILDSPEEYIAETQTREQEVLRDLAVTFLGCTTPSLLSSSMPAEVTSSGFMSRFVLVVERDTDRMFPMPGIPPARERAKLMKTLERLKSQVGEMTLSWEALKWYEEWYVEKKKEIRAISDDHTAEALARRPTHMLKTAILIHMVQCDNFRICQPCIEAAARMLQFVQKSTPGIVQVLKQTLVATDMDYVKNTLARLGGAADHSTLVRRVSGRMNSTALKSHLRTLREGGHIREGRRGTATYYILNQEAE
jgi:hypothetical protein